MCGNLDLVTPTHTSVKTCFDNGSGKFTRGHATYGVKWLGHAVARYRHS